MDNSREDACTSVIAKSAPYAPRKVTNSLFAGYRSARIYKQ